MKEEDSLEMFKRINSLSIKLNLNVSTVLSSTVLPSLKHRFVLFDYNTIEP